MEENCVAHLLDAAYNKLDSPADWRPYCTYSVPTREFLSALASSNSKFEEEEKKDKVESGKCVGSQTSDVAHEENKSLEELLFQTEFLQVRAKFEHQCKMISDVRETGEKNKKQLISALSRANDEREEELKQMRSILETRLNETDDRLNGVINKDRQEMKTRLEEQAKEIEQLKKIVAMNERAVSTLFTKMNQSNDETREEMREVRANQEIKLADCNGRVSGATAAMSTLFRSMLEEGIEKEVASSADKHKEEISQLKQKMEEMSEELKQSQLSLKTQLEDGLKRLKIGNHDETKDDKREAMIEETINILEKNIFECESKEDLIDNDIQPKDINLRNSIVVLKPEEIICPMNNPKWSLSIKWIIYGLEKMILQRKTFEVVSQVFQFPLYPFSARVKMQWKDDSIYAHFSMHLEDAKHNIKYLLKPPPLRFMLEKQELIRDNPNSYCRRLSYEKREDINYVGISGRNLINKRWFTHPTVNVNDSVVIGIGVDTDAVMEQQAQPDLLNRRLINYRGIKSNSIPIPLPRKLISKRVGPGVNSLGTDHIII